MQFNAELFKQAHEEGRCFIMPVALGTPLWFVHTPDSREDLRVEVTRSEDWLYVLYSNGTGIEGSYVDDYGVVRDLNHNFNYDFTFGVDVFADEAEARAVAGEKNGKIDDASLKNK